MTLGVAEAILCFPAFYGWFKLLKLNRRYFDLFCTLNALLVKVLRTLYDYLSVATRVGTSLVKQEILSWRVQNLGLNLGDHLLSWYMSLFYIDFPRGKTEFSLFQSKIWNLKRWSGKTNFIFVANVCVFDC